MENNNNKLKRESKYMMGLFSFVGVFLILTIVLINFTPKATYSAETCFCTPPMAHDQGSCEAAGGSWSCTTEQEQTCADLGASASCPYDSICNKVGAAADGICYQVLRKKNCSEISLLTSCPDDSVCSTSTAPLGDTCYTVIRKKSCPELNSNWIASCRSGYECGEKNSYGCYEYERVQTSGGQSEEKKACQCYACTSTGDWQLASTQLTTEANCSCPSGQQAGWGNPPAKPSSCVATGSVTCTNGSTSSSECSSLAATACGGELYYTGCKQADSNGCYKYGCTNHASCTTNGGESKTTCQTNANRECGTNNWTGCTNAIHDEDNTISCFSYKCNDNCIFGAITQNSAGGIFASVSATGNKTASECCASKGWDYRGGKCYTKGTLIVGGKEYNWTNSLDGQCGPGYKYDESLKLCVDELCDCGDGGCSDAPITVTGGGGTTYTPGDTPTNPTPDTPSTNCYKCSTSSGDKYTNATSPSNAAAATGGSNCSIVSDSYCQSQSSTNCYECVVNDKKQHTMATSESEAKTKTGGSSCTKVTTNKCNTTENPKTGTLAIIVAWIVGIATLCYAGWYFMKSKSLNK